MVLQVQYTLFLSDVNKTSIFWGISENTYISNFMKTVQWESSRSMRSDMTKLTVAFRNFTNANTKCKRSLRT